MERYRRHIIIPQIGREGQKKLLEAHVTVVSERISNIEVLLNYLAAVGFNNINCYLEDVDDSQTLIKHLKDLNPELIIRVIPMDEVKVTNGQEDLRVIIGHKPLIKKATFLLKDISFVPTLIGLMGSWKGVLQFCTHKEKVNFFLEKVLAKNSATIIDDDEIGNYLSRSFLGTIGVTELIKAHLCTGSLRVRPLYFDLLQTVFSSNIEGHPYGLKEPLESKKLLKNKKVLLVGTGGLGSPVALALVKLGIGTVGLLDYDKVETSNLNRQILHSTSKINKFKVDSAKELLTVVNPEVKVETYPYAFTKKNSRDIIRKYDIVVDGLDNIPTRYILNDGCYQEKKPFVEAGVLTFYGQITTIKPQLTPCYRCFLPENQNTGLTTHPCEVGVLGPVPGLIGTLQATEVIKMVLGIESKLEGNILMYDGFECEFNLIPYLKSNKCILCGS